MSLKWKLVSSLSRPFSLTSCQVRSQSVVGLANSALQGMYSMVWSARVYMVKLSSTKSLVHWLIVMVITFSGDSSFTLLIVEKKSGE